MLAQRAYEVLRDHPFTQGFSEPHLAELAASATEVKFREDQIIFPAGDESRHFYLVVSGSLCVEISTPVYTVCIQAVGPGQAFGWSALLDHEHTMFQVRAREASTALCLDGVQICEACRRDPAFGFEFLRRVLDLVAHRLRATELRLAEFCGIPNQPRRRSSGACPKRARRPERLRSIR